MAASINGNLAIDIPSGIGLCLYITRACLNAVGPLREDFHPGYLEDADFCLRARQRGFRNVCAPSVFIGHAGSRSFAHNKRALVVRNLRKIDLRFPRHSLECASFMSADPLRPFREAIERGLPPRRDRPRILISGPAIPDIVVQERSRQLASEHQAVLVFAVKAAADGPHVRIVAADGRVPQSIQCDVSRPAERDWLRDYICQTSAIRDRGARSWMRAGTIDRDTARPSPSSRSFHCRRNGGGPNEEVVAHRAAARPAIRCAGLSPAVGTQRARFVRWRRLLLDQAETIIVPSETAMIVAQALLDQTQDQESLPGFCDFASGRAPA